MSSHPKIISTFAGCGGLDLGFKHEGYQTVWANDFNEAACLTYKKNLGDHIVNEDITNIDPFTDLSIPDADVVLGGFPCQDFSVIWKQEGLEGKRGGLYKNFRDFVAAKQPKVFVAENVKGLLTANKKLAIKTILEDLEAVNPGYLVKPRLYNFAEYGVPQLRERVLIVGIRLDTGFNFKHPKPTHGPRSKNTPFKTAGEALKDVAKVPFNNEIPNHRSRTREIINAIPQGGNYTDIAKTDDLYVKGMISHVYRRLHKDQPSRTIIAAGGGGTSGYHFSEPRALTNRERARLQSFPDSFVFEGSSTEVRRQIGNAVPPEGVYALAERLMKLFTGDYELVDLHSEAQRLKGLSVTERLKEADSEVN